MRPPTEDEIADRDDRFGLTHEDQQYDRLEAYLSRADAKHFHYSDNGDTPR